MRVVPTAVSVSPQQEKEGPFPMQYMRCAGFFFSTLSVIYYIFARASQVSFTKCWPRYCCSTGQETCLKQTDNSDWFHFYFTLTFRLHRRCNKKKPFNTLNCHFRWILLSLACLAEIPDHFLYTEMSQPWPGKSHNKWHPTFISFLNVFPFYTKQWRQLCKGWMMTLAS